MKILLIGGTGFIGRFVTSQLQQAGHTLTVFHRGATPAAQGVEQIVGDRNHLEQFRELFRQRKLDVVVDFVLSSEDQAKQLMTALRGATLRVVALSSMDAYRAWGVLTGMEQGGPEP